MTDFAAYFLLQARERDNDFTGAIIFFLIWGAIAVLSQYGKWKERNRKQQQQSPTAAPPPVPSVIRRIVSEAQPQQRRQGNPLRVQPRPPQARGPLPQPPKRQQKAQRRPIAPAVLNVQAKRPPEPIVREDSGEAKHEIGSHTEKTRYKPVVSARELRETVRPMSLRKHLLVMELLMPPVGLRNENEQS